MEGSTKGFRRILNACKVVFLAFRRQGVSCRLVVFFMHKKLLYPVVLPI